MDVELGPLWTGPMPRRMGWKNCLPNPGRRKMATPWARHLLATRLHRQNSPFLTWARPIFEQGALSPMSVLPADFPILCLPGDKLFQSKDVEKAYCLPNSACFSWKQSRNRKETPTVAMAGSTPAGCRTNRS